ncbi:DNA topoisomerase III [Sporolactobacillus sp. Y61]|uniref:DNA topoisomerase n=1 Tax=Sporolactobacillus sp. Y61 TaxID=3160863 RepID=A0AAU8IJH8_9BACL
MKTLILAEKPSVARDMARVLKCQRVNKHFIEGDRYLVTWALGHLIELKMPEEYDIRYKTWRLEDLPVIPKKMETKPIRQTSAQFHAIKKLSGRADLKDLVIATDAGREGELVARWIIEKIHWRKPVRRLWISSQTDKAIHEGFRNLKPAEAYNNLYKSAVCRSEADWLIGLNISRALTTKYNDSLSAGRVQTPTLSMIIHQEKKIKAFHPQPFWTISAAVGSFTATWQNGSQTRILNQDRANKIIQKLSGKKATVRHVMTKKKTERQPLLYDLTELQRDANRKFGYSARKTLNILQVLYERYKIVTYPRTDSRYLTKDIEPTMRERLKAILSAYSGEVRPILHKKNTHVRASFVFNDRKVGDHHALIPTEEPVFIQDLSEDEVHVYDLIIRRFLSIFYPERTYMQMRAELSSCGETLVINQTLETDPGFTVLSHNHRNEVNQPADTLKQGDELPVLDLLIHHKMTEPPARLSEADLLTKMEKFGLGTPATRADIIEKLIQSESIRRESGGRLAPTSKGQQLIQLVNPDLKSPDLTARWERELENIARGSGNPDHFMKEIRNQTKQLVQEVRTSDNTYKIQNLTKKKCPQCGSPMKESRARDGGRILICINRACHYRKRMDPKLSNHRCPHCHKKMEIHKGKAGAYFQCRTCGIVEKAENIGKKINKRETRRLMNKINNKNGSFSNSLEDALKAAMKKEQE